MSKAIQNQLNRSFTLDDGSFCLLKNFGSQDLEPIYQLEQRSNPHPWSKRNFEDSLASSHICVGVEEEGRWIAHAVFSIASGDAELLLITVDSAWQGRGVARKAIKIMVEMLEDFAAELFLEVRASNSRAIKMYDQFGFNCLGVRPGYYPSADGREDAHIYGMSLRIG